MRRGFLKNSDAVAAVEFALIFVPLMIFILGTFELSRLYYIDHNLEKTADNIARFMMQKYSEKSISKAAYKNDLEKWIIDNYRFDDPSKIIVTVYFGVKNGYQYREFKLTKPVKLMIPMFNNSIDVDVVRQIPY